MSTGKARVVGREGSSLLLGGVSDSSLVRIFLISLSFAALTMVAAHIRVLLPFTPVPVTMQTLVVLVAGLSLGSAWGGISQAKYLLLGAFGLPAFSGGLMALVSPSGGYLVGFVAAAFVVGGVYSLLRTTLGAIIACLAGSLTIYFFGLLWLAVITGASFTELMVIGVLPFVVGDLLKMMAAILLVRGPITGKWLSRLLRQAS